MGNVRGGQGNASIKWSDSEHAGYSKRDTGGRDARVGDTEGGRRSDGGTVEIGETPLMYI